MSDDRQDIQDTILPFSAIVGQERMKLALILNAINAIIGASLGLINRQDMSPVLPSMSMPCFVYCGDADGLHVGAAECVKHMLNVQWVSLPGLDHSQAMERSEMVLPHIMGFLNQETMP